MYSPPCCLNDGSIWFLKLFTVSSLSLFQVSTTRCVKKYFRTFSLQCCLRMVREWPLRPVAVRSWKKSSRFTPSKLCIRLTHFSVVSFPVKVASSSIVSRCTHLLPFHWSSWSFSSELLPGCRCPFGCVVATLVRRPSSRIRFLPVQSPELWTHSAVVTPILLHILLIILQLRVTIIPIY